MSDQLAPVTSSIGFLRLSIDAAAEALVDWRRELHPDVKMREVSGNLPTLIRMLEPLTGGIRPRELLVRTTDECWTAYFDCGVQGGDPSSTVAYLARTVHCQGVVVRSVPHTIGTSLEKPGRYGCVQFEMFGPLMTDFLNYVRSVSVAHDGSRWRFDANGTVQDFEQIEAYTARRIRDRFTSEMLVAYGAALGLHPFEDGFYAPGAVFVESSISIPPGAKVLSLAETQHWLGIVPGVAQQLDG